MMTGHSAERRDCPMTNKDLAAAIADRFIYLEMHLQALRSVLADRMTPEQLAKLDQAATVAENQVLPENSFQQRSGQIRDALEAARDEAALVGILHDHLLRRARIH